jgi:hypothetical protein
LIAPSFTASFDVSPASKANSSITASIEAMASDRRASGSSVTAILRWARSSCQTERAWRSDTP